MSDRDAPLSAIHNAPDDDAPRLVFADWLDENGEPERAEFIRVQVEMRRERERHDRITPRLDELFLRQKELFQHRWADTGRRCGAGTISNYSRGFPDGLTVKAAEFAGLGIDIFIWVGPQTRLCLYECAGMMNRVASQASLCRFRSLAIGTSQEENPHRDEDMAEFFASPHLSAFRKLAIRAPSRPFRRSPADPLTAGTASAIATARSLTGLAKLDMSGIDIGSDGIVALASTAHLKTLRTLRLPSMTFSARAIEALVESPHLVQLDRLDIVGEQLSPVLLSRLNEHFGTDVICHHRSPLFEWFTGKTE